LIPRPNRRGLSTKQHLQLPETFSLPAENSTADFSLNLLAKRLRIRQLPGPLLLLGFSVV
jgi:hypothetical protein